MRAAVYSGTRNVYQDMLTSAKSLLIYSNVDKIYFLIEDDQFPYDLPKEIECINVSHQTYFRADGPNFSSPWTYMILMRLALSKIFPQLDIILSLDMDTIVNENISELWNLDLGDNYFAAAIEPIKSTDTFLSINAGVMLINLKKLREDKKDDELINALNTKEYKFPEQDCITELCQNHILILPPDYNMNDSVDYKNAHFRRIIHYAGLKEWRKYGLVKKYQQMPIDNLPRDQYKKTDLDIIIPSYNNLKGLEMTLESLYYPELLDWINIIIVDDGAYLNYDEIKEQFPQIKIIQVEKNSGPGNARKVGIKNSTGAYITFVDCGDVILSKYCLYAVKDEIEHNRIPDIYEWSWINGDSWRLSKIFDISTPGKVYSRQFLESNMLYPLDNGPGSYAAEDCGLNLSCYSVINDYGYDEDTPHIQHYPLPIYQSVVNQNSLTYKNNKEFWYTALPGIVDNAIYYMQNCQRLGVNKDIINEQANVFLIDLYKDFLKCTRKRPELLESHWTELRKFYFEFYQHYENNPNNSSYQRMYYGTRLNLLLKLIARPNIIRFIDELKNNPTVPESYYLNYIS